MSFAKLRFRISYIGLGSLGVFLMGVLWFTGKDECTVVESKKLSGIRLHPVSVLPVWSRSNSEADSTDFSSPYNWKLIETKFAPDLTTKPFPVLLHHVENWLNEEKRSEEDTLLNGSKLLLTLLGSSTDTASNVGSVPLFRDLKGRPHVLSLAQNPTAEAHFCQFLAVCANLGLPSNELITSGKTSATVGELVEVVREDFHLYGELEWKTMVLARYAPTQYSWTNRWGRSFDFDIIAKKMLSRPYGEGACAGSHALQCLSVLLRVDAEYPLFKLGTRDRIQDYLHGAALLLGKTQRPAGYWAPDWATPLSDPQDSVTDELLFDQKELARATGHHLEWTSLVPAKLAINRAVRDKAVNWCKRMLEEISLNDINSDICSYSHCFRILRYHAVGRRTPGRKGYH